jgi:HPt (histidine-containing phosphotransfer) domain-containing protein
MKSIDYEAALSQFGSPENLASVLRVFLAKTPAIVAGLENPEAGDLSAYAITVHGLKGALYGICAAPAGDAAAGLEKLAKQDRLAEVRQKTPELTAACGKLFTEIEALLAAQAPGSAGQETKEKQAFPDKGLLKKIGEAAARFKTSEIENLVGELDSFQYEKGGDLVKWLKEQSENLEYNAIAKRLSAM